ncbi:uncharacterized protein [Antedon mediterranea]|uniref:uncharacterized protein n=1 Tax=Antedon mediterranea TaxID=105859 RepID=UPI003AF952F8
MSRKRKYNTLNDEVKEILMSYWERGMDSYGCEGKRKLIADAAIECGITQNQVKDWVGNNRKKVTGKKYQRSETIKKKTPSGYNLFFKDYYVEELAKGNTKIDIFKGAPHVWNQLKESGEAEKYFSMANKLELPDVTELSEAQKNKQIDLIIKEVNVKIQKLSDLGVECIATFVTPMKSIVEVGTQVGKQFIEQDNTNTKFAAFVHLTETGVLPVNTVKEATNKKRLRAEVQKLFNRKYFEATGKAHVSYKEVDCGKIYVSGLPDGIVFNRPSSYGVAAMERIINENNITFALVTDAEQEASGPSDS